MDKDEKEGKKTYIYMTKLIMDDKMKEKITETKDKKFSKVPAGTAFFASYSFLA